MFSSILEWVVYFSPFVSVYMYGKEGLWGPISGIAVAILWMVYGEYVIHNHAMVWANLGFWLLHANNLRKKVL